MLQLNCKENVASKPKRFEHQARTWRFAILIRFSFFLIVEHISIIHFVCISFLSLLTLHM